jgi:predicted nuclease with TOPRIM domain
MEEAQKSPSELRAERFESLRSQWESLSDSVSLSYPRSEIRAMDRNLRALPDKIAEFRRRGYVYQGEWESIAEELLEKWPDREREAERILRNRVRDFDDLAEDIEKLCERRRLSENELDLLEHKIDRLRSDISNAERDVRGAYAPLESQYDEMLSAFRDVDQMLDYLEEASFKLYADEHGVDACEAVWASDREEPEGIFFLTNSRIIFEQREKKAKKKVLFVTTKSELIQEKLWEGPVGAISEIEIEDKGGFIGIGSKEILTLHFSERTRELPGSVTLQIKGSTNEHWQTLIQQVQRGQLAAERYDTGAAGAVAEAGAPPPLEPKDIPTECPACGAKLPTYYQGMKELTCEYCGKTVYL